MSQISFFFCVFEKFIKILSISFEDYTLDPIDKKLPLKRLFPIFKHLTKHFNSHLLPEPPEILFHFLIYLELFECLSEYIIFDLWPFHSINIKKCLELIVHFYKKSLSFPALKSLIFLDFHAFYDNRSQIYLLHFFDRSFFVPKFEEILDQKPIF